MLVLIRFGPFQVGVCIGSIGFQVGSDSVQSILCFVKWVRVDLVLGRFSFVFGVEISSTLSDVDSGLVSSHLVQVIWIRLDLPILGQEL